MALLFFLILGFVRLTELLSKRWNDYRFRIRVCRLPVISDFFRLLQTHSLAYPLGALLGVGLTLSEAIAFIKNDPEKAYLKETALRLERQLKEGKTLVEAISAIPLWMEEFPHVVEHGQLEGDLAKELEVYGRYCLEAFEDRMDRFIRVVQPAIFGLIALWILLMYFSILLPSYQLIETL
jgi:Bacterial type II secretion system protein F domain.